VSYDRIPNILLPHAEDLFHFAPVPLVYHVVPQDVCQTWHPELIADARRAMSRPILDVPDVRHVKDLGSPFHFPDPTWREEHLPAIGVWHQVPTNAYLKLDTPCVQRLTTLIEARFLNALTLLGVKHGGQASITESWIQFYESGDYKVLHNHERYSAPYDPHRWSGAYYITDGAPDQTMPYSGVLSFRVRQDNYLIRPISGLLLLWPADILHEVHPFYGKDHRIVVNFNIQPRQSR
jgi:Putative 2OG-Fe(II) oxygenase